MKNLFLLLVITVLTISSCSKKDEPVSANNPATQTCFLDSFNGTYVGQSGSTTTGDDVTVKLTKTGCTTCSFESVGMGNKTVTGLTASAAGGFTGKLNDGKDVAIALSGTSLSIASETYTFSGTKQ